MEQESISKRDVIIAGLGGMGVLSAGHILSCVALNQYRYVSNLPSYAVEKRGGLCECTVIFSNEDIASPIIYRAQTVIVLAGSQLETFEPRVLPGGMMLVESSGLDDRHEAKDYKLIKVPGLEIAISLGIGQINNLILLGAYIGVIDEIPPELIEQELGRRFEKNKVVLEKNQKAFEQGVEWGRTIEKQGL